MSAPASIAIRNARIVDPLERRDEIGDLFLAHGRFVEAPPAGEIVEIDAQGRTVVPAFIDLHTHLREPGNECAETIATGTRAAARGGFSTVVSMPNTTPPADSPERIRFVIERARAAGFATVLPAACLTHNREGRALADLSALAAAGAVAFSDDGSTVFDDTLMEQAMRQAADLDIPVMDHAQDPRAEARGVMHAGESSARFGLPGIPAEAEADIVARDIRLAAATGCRLHIQHVSAAASVDLLRIAQAEGLSVTGELTPHHLALCDLVCDPENANFKMNPPLRSRDDREHLVEGILDGTLAAFATDHAPHTADAKARGFRNAPFGIVGLETAIGVTYTELVRKGLMDLHAWIERWTLAPARILGISPPTLASGAPAHLALLDLETEWRVSANAFASRSANSPFLERTLTGRSLLTLHAGRIVWRENPTPNCIP